jgi:hypothetical protein
MVGSFWHSPSFCRKIQLVEEEALEIILYMIQESFLGWLVHLEIKIATYLTPYNKLSSLQITPVQIVSIFRGQKRCLKVFY